MSKFNKVLDEKQVRKLVDQVRTIEFVAKDFTWLKNRIARMFM